MLLRAKGNTIHCPNAIFIMTSNLVQDEIREAIREGQYQLRPDMASKTSAANKRHGDEQQQQPLLQTQRNRLLNNVRGIGGLASANTSSEPLSHSSEQEQQHRSTTGRDRASTEDALPSAAPSFSSSAGTAAIDIDTAAAVADSAAGAAATAGGLSVPNTVETIVPAPSTRDVDPAAISLVAKSTDDFLRYQIHPILKRHFKREEFLGRINGTNRHSHCRLSSACLDSLTD